MRGHRNRVVRWMQIQKATQAIKINFKRYDMTIEESAELLAKLSRLKDACLRLHDNSITYQVCEILQKVILDITQNNNKIEF